jgi:hypothetical protein
MAGVIKTPAMKSTVEKDLGRFNADLPRRDLRPFRIRGRGLMKSRFHANPDDPRSGGA